MPSLKCRHCGHEPVARDIRTCPRCLGKFPNPSPFIAACDRGVKIGGMLGVPAGLIWGFAIENEQVGVFGRIVIGVIVGTLGGLLFGLIGGMLWGAVADRLEK